MADPQNNTADIGMATGPAPIPAAPSAIQPNPAAQPQATPASNDNSNSNKPDADTPAGASIPKALINNPAVPTQKMAAQADNNKNSVAPDHKSLHDAAEELAGGPQFTTRYDDDGTAIRTRVHPSLAHLGLALALNVLKGGIAGGNAKDSIAAAQAGAQVADQQRAKIKQANQEQDTQAKTDFQFKRSIAEANMRNYQTAVNVGNSTKEASQKFADSFKPISEGLQDGTIPLPEGVSKDEPQFETDAMAGIKNGKTNITHDIMIPVGDPLPVMGTNGQQKTVNGIPVWGHNYITVHDADKFQTTLTKDIQDKLHEIGMFQQDGKNAQIGEPAWSFADLMNKMSVYASVKAGEQLLMDHKTDAHDLLDREPEDLDNLATAVRTNPAMRKAVGLFAQAQQGTAGANSHIEDILNTMATKDPQSASTLMHFLKLTPADLDAMHNKRVEADTEAKTKANQSAEADRQKRLDLLTKDPITAANADSVIAAHNKPSGGVVIPEDRYQQAIAFNAQQANQAGAKAGKEAEQRVKAESLVGDIPTLAKNIVSGDFSKVGDTTSYKGGQRIALANALHDAAIAAGKNPNDFSPGALVAKSNMYNDYHSQKNGSTGSNITAFDAFLGHSGDALNANAEWKRANSPLLNKPLNWIATNATNDPTFVKLTTALEPVRKEFMAFLNANRAEHEADIKTMGTVLSNESTPLAIETALKQLGRSADIRLSSMGGTYQNTMGRPFENLISPQGRATLKTMGIVPGSNVKVQIPGQKPGSIAADQVAAFKAAHPDAIINEGK